MTTQPVTAVLDALNAAQATRACLTHAIRDAQTVRLSGTDDGGDSAAAVNAAQDANVAAPLAACAVEDALTPDERREYVAMLAEAARPHLQTAAA